MTPVVRAVLKFCNDLRATKGLDPLDALPKGYRHSIAHSPIAIAVGGTTWSHCMTVFPSVVPPTPSDPGSLGRYVEFRKGSEVWYPAVVDAFLWGFDRKHYPELAL